MVADTFDGMPSYESETGKLLVFDTLVAFDFESLKTFGTFAGVMGGTMFFSRWYGSATVLSCVSGGDGLCPLWHDPDALWIWRPVVYELGVGGLRRLGSQMELEWREGLMGAMRETHQGIPDAREAANARARALLLEHLNDQQRLDYLAWDHFYVRGEVNRLYCVDVANGFDIVCPLTREPIVSFCLHPEGWLPHEDVALATKLLIDQGVQGEKELLEAARPNPLRRRKPRESWMSRAWEIERELLAA